MDLTATGSPLQRDEGFLMVEVDRFHGPLDLLLHLIRQQDIDIFDIPIARITDQFLVAVARIRAEELDSAGEFLEMAATLVRIKAQMLLPRPYEEGEEDPRAELVRRLLEYEQIREISQRLSSAEAERSRRFGKGYVEPRKRRPEEDVPLETTWEELWEAALEVEAPRRRDTPHRIATLPVAMDDKISLILETLRRVSRVEFGRLTRPWNRMHGVMTFLAGLELGRRRLVALRQTRPFADLWYYRTGDLEQGEGTGAVDRDEEGGTGDSGILEEGDGSGAEDGGRATAGEGRVAADGADAGDGDEDSPAPEEASA